MTMQTMQFDLDSLFNDLENETKLQSVLVFPKKGDELVLAMLPPLEYEGKPKLSVAIEAEFNGKISQQHIIRFAMLNKNGKTIDWDKTQFVGIPLAPTYVAQIVKAYKSEFQLAQQEQSLIILTKADKTNLVFTPKTVKIPDEVWNADNQPTWEQLLKAHEDMKTNIAAKKDGKGKKEESKDESTPWDN